MKSRMYLNSVGFSYFITCLSFLKVLENLSIIDQNFYIFTKVEREKMATNTWVLSSVLGCKPAQFRENKWTSTIV